MKCGRSCKLGISSFYYLEVELLLYRILRQVTSHFLFFFLLHYSPNFSWDRPMVDRNIRLLAFFLIEVVVLTNMCSAGGISSLVKSLALSFGFDKVFVFPGSR
jgi:hypothetical protein